MGTVSGMVDFIFYLFAFLTLGSALWVVFGRNAVNSAMFMILSFGATAGLFLLLNAYFLFALQIIVYAGAVMVLFLFIVMLLNVDKAGSVKPDKLGAVVAILAGLLLAGGMVYTFTEGNPVPPALEPVSEPVVSEDGGLPYSTQAASYGHGLFTKYMLPVQVTGFLLLVAMMGVILISKRVNADGEVSS